MTDHIQSQFSSALSLRKLNEITTNLTKDCFFRECK